MVAASMARLCQALAPYPSEPDMAGQRMPGITVARSEPTMAPRVSPAQMQPRPWGERKGEDTRRGEGAAEALACRLGPATRAAPAAASGGQGR